MLSSFSNFFHTITNDKMVGTRRSSGGKGDASKLAAEPSDGKSAAQTEHDEGQLENATSLMKLPVDVTSTVGDAEVVVANAVVGRAGDDDNNAKLSEGGGFDSSARSAFCAMTPICWSGQPVRAVAEPVIKRLLWWLQTRYTSLSRD